MQQWQLISLKKSAFFSSNVESFSSHSIEWWLPEFASLSIHFLLDVPSELCVQKQLAGTKIKVQSQVDNLSVTSCSFPPQFLFHVPFQLHRWHFQ